MLTYHGLRQTRRRTGLNINASARLIEKALCYGKTANDFPERERNYLLSKASASEGKRVVVYNGFCFIFSKDDACITTFPVSRWFNKKVYHDGKSKIREPKKYMRYCDLFWCEEGCYAF